MAWCPSSPGDKGESTLEEAIDYVKAERNKYSEEDYMDYTEYISKVMVQYTLYVVKPTITRQTKNCTGE